MIVRKYSTETTNLQLYLFDSYEVYNINTIIIILLNSNLQFYYSEGIDITLQRIFIWVNKDEIDMTKDVTMIFKEFNLYIAGRSYHPYDVAVLLR